LTAYNKNTPYDKKIHTIRLAKPEKPIGNIDEFTA
jgi:hypothetical protein